jgi:hypothetical protein
MDVEKFSIFPATELGDLYSRACGGNPDAQIFLGCWLDIIHRIDDQIDEGITHPEFLLQTCAFLNLIYTTPFYQENSARLSMVVILVTNAYADSVAGEHSDKIADQAIADVIRFCGNEMVLAVAFITGGYANMRALSMPLRRYSWVHHHEAEAKE